MIGITDTLYTEMQHAIRELAVTELPFLKRAERSFYIAESYLLKLREVIGTYNFQDEEEEIQFFKSIKPRFHKELIYWSEVVRIASRWPASTEVGQKRDLKQQVKEIRSQMERHKFLYDYSKLGRVDLDKFLFLREAEFIPFIPIDRTDLDRTFSTLAGNILASLMALEEVVTWLSTRHEKPVPDVSGEETPGLVWTGSKAQLIELVYALESYGVFNNGKTNVKEVMGYLQHCFKVDKVANYYGYFQGIRIRKKDRTPFLNGLIEHITRRMDESDEFPRFS